MIGYLPFLRLPIANGNPHPRATTRGTDLPIAYRLLPLFR